MRGLAETEKQASNGPLSSDRTVNGTTAFPWPSSRRRPSLLSVLERLRGCQDAWCPGAPWGRERAHAALSGTAAGSFLAVRDATASARSEPGLLLCVSTGGDQVADYPIQRSPAAFQLSQSHLGFLDLPQLVLFYSLTRDVLSVCLSIPSWVYYGVTEQTDARLSQLDPKSWLCVNSDPQDDHVTSMEPNLVMCSIQMTPANEAVCFINRLYLHEHGDDWLADQPLSPQLSTQLSVYDQERRLSGAGPWGGVGAGLRSQQRACSLDQGIRDGSTESSGLTRAQSEVISHQPTITPTSPTTTTTTTTTETVVLRRASSSSGSSLKAGSMGSFPTTADTSRVTSSDMSSALQPLSSPYRVSWIEDGVWRPPPRSPSSRDPHSLEKDPHSLEKDPHSLEKDPHSLEKDPHSLEKDPHSLEMDSLSIGSVDSQDEPDTLTSLPLTSSTHGLASKVKNRLSALVGQAIGGLVCPKRRLAMRAQDLCERGVGAFAEAVRGFVETTLRGGVDPGGVRGLEFLQEVRLALTALRDPLLDSPDATVQTLLDGAPQEDFDSMVELALHRVALKPVSTHLYFSLQAPREEDGSLASLRRNQRVLEGRTLQELEGSPGAGVPDGLTLEHMQQRWSHMHRAYCPSKKVEILLKVCKSVYRSMSANASPGAVFGADDFLPCLTWTLLRSDVVTVQLDTDYMMELLDPTQLQGEKGYYLTSVYASLYYISSFRPRVAARQLSFEAQKSLSQWHRRRTLHCNTPRRSMHHRRTIRRHGTDRGRPRQQDGGESDRTHAAPSSSDPPQPSEEGDGNTLEPVMEALAQEDDNGGDVFPSLVPSPLQRTTPRAQSSGGQGSAVRRRDEEEKGVMGDEVEREPGEQGEGAEEGQSTHAPVHRSFHHCDVMWTTHKPP